MNRVVVMWIFNALVAIYDKNVFLDIITLVYTLYLYPDI